MALNAQKPENKPYNAINYSDVDSDVEALNAASKKKDDVCCLAFAFYAFFHLANSSHFLKSLLIAQINILLPCK